MISFSPKIKIKKSTDEEAVIEIENLYPGYGITLGNALRRVLLSSIEGAAPTSFYIKEVNHEFSTIEGVEEDLIEISLNLKKLRVKLFSDEPQTLTLQVKGEREVKASDFEKNPLVSVINSNLHIANLSDKNAELKMDVRFEKGTGFYLAKERRTSKLPIGTIELDANFSPVKIVNFQIENMVVGERTDYNRLILQIITDGTVSPLEAYEEAIKILIDHLEKIRFKEGLGAEEDTFKVLRESKDINSIPLEDTELSSRVLNVLTKHRIKTITDLSKTSIGKISKFEGLGEKGIEEIKKIAKKYGVNLS